MRTAIWSVILTVCLSPLCGPGSSHPVKLKSLDGTAQIELTGTFVFSISPNDQWLVFFNRGDPERPDPPEVDALYGRLRVMNLLSDEVYSFTLREDQVAMSLLNYSDASWAPDSSMCVLPPPNVDDRRVVIKFTPGEKPTLSFLPHPRKPRKPSDPPPDEQINMPERFTCSDCYSRPSDIDLLKKHVPKEFQFGGTVTRDSYAREFVSPDGTRIYHQKGPQEKPYPPGNQETALFEVDVTSGKERKLVAHDGTCPTIYQLRPSPDGKKLAYQVNTGCGFGSVTEIYVLDLNTAKTEYIALGSGTMHWTSASDRLFFYRRFMEGPPADHLWVAELGKSEPAQTQPRNKAP